MDETKEAVPCVNTCALDEDIITQNVKGGPQNPLNADMFLKPCHLILHLTSGSVIRLALGSCAVGRTPAPSNFKNRNNDAMALGLVSDHDLFAGS